MKKRILMYAGSAALLAIIILTWMMLADFALTIGNYY